MISKYKIATRLLITLQFILWTGYMIALSELDHVSFLFFYMMNVMFSIAALLIGCDLDKDRRKKEAKNNTY